MLAQPDQNRRAALDAVVLLRLFVRELAFFHLLHHRQLKGQRVVALRAFDT